jgi:hypothetical protein
VHAAARSWDSAEAPEMRTPLSEEVVTSGTTPGVSARNRQQVEEDQLGQTGAAEKWESLALAVGK